MKKVAYFTNIAPHYREKLWLAFTKHTGVEWHFFFGYNPNQSIASIDFSTSEWSPMQSQVHKVKNINLSNRLVFQRNVIRQVLFSDWDCIVLLGDANILSNWFIALAAKWRGIPIVLWGHGMYGSEPFIKKIIRKSFLTLASTNLVYGHWARNLMIKENFLPQHVKVIYNSVNYEISKPLREIAQIPNFYRSYFQNELPTIIFIGRLTKIKKLHLLIHAIHELNTPKKQFNLIFIGDGNVKSELEDLANQLGEKVYFYGACYEEEKIAQFLANADLCVSPGNVGLTSIHAMSYGTPVCTNNDFKNQMPEFEAIKEGVTGCFFDNEKENLASTISNWFKQAPPRNIIRKNCFQVVDDFYNPEVQVQIMKEVLDELINPLPKVAYFTNIAPHYREKLWLSFTKELNIKLHFFFGRYINQSIAGIDFKKSEWNSVISQVHEINNYKIDKRLIYQRKVLRKVAFQSWDAIILLGDANIVSNWLIALVAKIKGIPVIFWGHGLYGNEYTLKKWVRKLFLLFADYNLVYGHWARNLLLKENFHPDKVKVIYNSVNYELSKPLREKSIVPNFYQTYFQNELPTLIFIGRLTKEKKLHLLIEAVSKLNKNKKRFNLILIGDGEDKKSLVATAAKLKVEALFYGACYDEEKIALFMSNADLCVSPGNVGLTSVHAMSYGTPACTVNDFINQGPEFEAIRTGETGCFFDKVNGNLAETIEDWFNKNPNREQIRQNCYHVIDTYYNPSVQIQVFKEVIDEVLKKNNPT